MVYETCHPYGMCQYFVESLPIWHAFTAFQILLTIYLSTSTNSVCIIGRLSIFLSLFTSLIRLSTLFIFRSMLLDHRFKIMAKKMNGIGEEGGVQRRSNEGSGENLSVCI